MIFSRACCSATEILGIAFVCGKSFPTPPADMTHQMTRHTHTNQPAIPSFSRSSCHLTRALPTPPKPPHQNLPLTHPLDSDIQSDSMSNADEVAQRHSQHLQTLLEANNISGAIGFVIENDFADGVDRIAATCPTWDEAHLMTAVQKKRLGVLDRMLHLKVVSPDIKNRVGKPLLFMALADLPTLLLLLQHGADPNAVWCTANHPRYREQCLMRVYSLAVCSGGWRWRVVTPSGSGSRIEGGSTGAGIVRRRCHAQECLSSIAIGPRSTGTRTH